MIYNGYDLSDLLIVGEGLQRSIAPTNEIFSTGRGGHGERYAGARMGSGIITVPIILIPDDKDVMTVEEMRRKVAGVLRAGLKKPCKLILPDAPDVYHMAMLSGDTNLERLSYTASTTLTFKCLDPFGYGAENAVSSTGGTVYCTVGGNVETAPVITVETQSSDAVVTVDGKTMTALGTLTGNEPLVFDCANRKVTKGGNVVKLSIYDDYAEWEPGMHEISCDLPFEARWHERWL